MTAKVIRVFEEDHPNGITTRRTLTRVVDVISVPRRGDRLLVPDVDEPLSVDRATLVASFTERAPVSPSPRAIIMTAPEPAERHAGALALGWRTV